MSNKKLLKYMQCIAPQNIKKAESRRHIIEIAKSLPIEDVNLDQLSIEWGILQIDEEISYKLNKNDNWKLLIFRDTQ